MNLHRLFRSGCMNYTGMYLSIGRNFYPKVPFRCVRTFSTRRGETRTPVLGRAPPVRCPLRYPAEHGTVTLHSSGTYRGISSGLQARKPLREESLLQGGPEWPVSMMRSRTTDTPISNVPTFTVMKFDLEGKVTSFVKKKTELYQELKLRARDLRFEHSTCLTARDDCIILRMAALKAIVTPKSLLVLDFRGLGLERWLVVELAAQLASQTHSLPFEFRALEAILQHRVNALQSRLNEVEPVILNMLDSLVDPQILSADRSKLHILLQNNKSLSELETDIKVFKESLLKILDEDDMIEELCLTKWTDPRVFEESSLEIDHAEEMELLLENYFMQAEELGNHARELKELIDDSVNVIVINLDSHRNVMMRLNLQLTMGSVSLTLCGLLGVAFGMNLTSCIEEDPWAFWFVTGIMYMGSGLLWKQMLSYLGRAT